MPHDVDRLAIETADFALDTAEQLEQQRRTLSRIALPDAERARAAQAVARHERTGLWRLAPRRNRWKELVEIDAAVDELDRRELEISNELQALFARIYEAEASYPQALAD